MVICQIKTHDSWVARVEFLKETDDERAQLATAPYKKNINDLHAEPKSITCATAKAMGVKVMGTFKPCVNWALGKAKKWGVSERLLLNRKFWEKGFSLT